MATNNSTLVDNYEALPATMSNVKLQGGRIRAITATVSVAAADNDGDIYMLAPIPTNAVVQHVWVYNDAITGGTDYDLGLYTTAGVAVDADCYADGQTMATAKTVAPQDLAYKTRDIANIGQEVWQDAGATSDPGGFYYLALTANTVGTVAGDISVIVEYTID